MFVCVCVYKGRGDAMVRVREGAMRWQQTALCLVGGRGLVASHA